MNELIRQHLVDCGLERFLPQFETLPLLSIRLKASRAEQAEMEIGSSRFGGDPDLPVDALWPTWEGVDLPFLAQINLAEVAALDPTCVLPKDGLLQFFYDYVANGSDPYHAGSAQVLYQSEMTSLMRRPARITTIPGDRKKIELPSFPMQIPECHPCSRLRFRREWTLPAESAPEVETLEWDESEQSEYVHGMELLYEPDWADPWCAMHRLLGWCQPIQNDMRLECQLASNGLYWGPRVENDPRFAELYDGAYQWRLLFQLDDDRYGAWELGGERLYFFIRHDDLVNHRFGNVWGIYQYD